MAAQPVPTPLIRRSVSVARSQPIAPEKSSYACSPEGHALSAFWRRTIKFVRRLAVRPLHRQDSLAQPLLTACCMESSVRDDAERQRSGSEVAFSLLRLLAKGYYLWGDECDVSLAELPRTIRTNRSELAQVIAQLWDLNLVALDKRRHTIRLSSDGVGQLVSVRRTLP
ncbi:MAG: hypothetical protein HY699_08930 [Deltaproteobacteria bacterium]|nr:hypothetical protein [Deltaproteobacteria bacterium]